MKKKYESEDTKQHRERLEYLEEITVVFSETLLNNLGLIGFIEMAKLKYKGIGVD